MKIDLNEEEWIFLKKLTAKVIGLSSLLETDSFEDIQKTIVLLNKFGTSFVNDKLE